MGKLIELKGVERPVTEWLSKMGWSTAYSELMRYTFIWEPKSNAADR